VIDAGEATHDLARESLVTDINSIPNLRADKKISTAYMKHA